MRVSTLVMAASSTSGILADIVATKRNEISELRHRSAALEQQAYERKSPIRPFAEALRTHHPAIIAEIKKASPSKGLLQSNFHPAFLANAYEQGGAACLSVLTDKDYFQGSWLDLDAARAMVSLPVLRKDFTLERIQVFEAVANGADAILLIAAILNEAQLLSLRELAESFGLACLVEVHDAEELQKAVASGATIIGVNNRDLTTFQVSLDTSVRLSYLMPAETIRVSESGISTAADIALLTEAGFNAFLVGETLMRSLDPALALQTLGCRA